MDDTRRHTVRETVDTSGVSGGTLYLHLDNSSSAQRASAEQARCISRALLPISVDRTQAREGSLAVTDAVVRTVGEMRQAMMPALQEILTAEELTATTITAVREPPEVRDRGNPFLPFEQWPRVADEELLDDQILLRVRTFTDSIGIWAGGGRETAAELHERFRSDLQDFVAESTFGWGQWRP